jgi:hypothetical protein
MSIRCQTVVTAVNETLTIGDQRSYSSPIKQSRKPPTYLNSNKSVGEMRRQNNEQEGLYRNTKYIAEERLETTSLGYPIYSWVFRQGVYMVDASEESQINASSREPRLEFDIRLIMQLGYVYLPDKQNPLGLLRGFSAGVSNAYPTLCRLPPFQPNSPFFDDLIKTQQNKEVLEPLFCCVFT